MEEEQKGYMRQQLSLGVGKYYLQENLHSVQIVASRNEYAVTITAAIRGKIVEIDMR
ncbi:hypothetical protein [Kineothrix sedimenti]|uniref:Uncharacterized protein n=1 Tax=Kineothrix sedimenti TaxID=3123317 RepID=A0ABZ3ESR9_9FIRM